MKKVLSFVLVLAMVLGAVSMAFAADYKDQAQITNTEAVGVLSMLKVLEGDSNGFRPKDTLTRAEAAAIVARLMLGREAADKLSAAGTSFSDVPSSHWASGYIAYCVSQGIVAGNGDGTFAPSGLLTVSAFSKMMLCALGYNAEAEGLVGSNWEANTVGLAVEAGISVSESGNCTRETAAQLGLNTLKADVVEYPTAPVTVNAGGAQVTVGGSKAQTKAPGGRDYSAAPSTAGDATLQLIEKVYGAAADNMLNTAGADEFGAPANVWTYKGSTVTAAKTAFKSYTKGLNTTAGKKTILADLKNYTFNGTKLIATTTTITTGYAAGDVAFAGGDVIVDDIAAATGNGRLVEVFVDGTEVTDIIITPYTVSKIASVVTAANGNVTYTGSNGLNGIDYADDEANTDTIKIHGTVAKGDYVTFSVNKAGNVQHVYPTTKVTGTQTAKTNTSITVDGTAYTIASGLAAPTPTAADFANATKAANYYLDQYGFVVAASDVESELVYAVVDRIALKVGSGVSNAKSVEAVLIFPDATKATVQVSKVNGTKAANITNAAAYINGADVAMDVVYGNNGVYNGIWSYVVDSDGKYELTTISAAKLGAGATNAVAGEALVTKGVAKITGAAVSANAETVYVVKTLKGTDEVLTAYTGYANVKTIKSNGAVVAAQYVLNQNNDAKVDLVYIDATNANTGDETTKNVFYAAANYDANAITGTGSNAYLTVKGYLNGAEVQQKFKSGATGSTTVASGTFYFLTLDDDGYSTNFAASAFDDQGMAVTQALADEVALGTINGYTINDETKVYFVDTNKVMTESAATVIAAGYDYYLLKVGTANAVQQNTVKTLYIVQH